MEQTTHAPGQLRRILPGVLLSAGLVWLMTGLFAPLTLGLLLAALMAPMAEALSRHTGCPRRLAAVGTMALFYLLLGLALTAAGSWAAGQGAQLLDGRVIVALHLIGQRQIGRVEDACFCAKELQQPGRFLDGQP